MLYAKVAGGISVLEALARGMSPPRVDPAALDARRLASLGVVRELRFLRFEGLDSLTVAPVLNGRAAPYAVYQHMVLELWPADPGIDDIQDHRAHTRRGGVGPAARSARGRGSLTN